MNAGLASYIVLGLVVVVLAIGAYALRKKGKRRVDYRSLFIMGAIWLPFGMVFLLMLLRSNRPFVVSVPFLAMGLIYLVIGLANKGKWKESQPLTANQKKITVGLTATGIIILLLALAIYLLRVFE